MAPEEICKLLESRFGESVILDSVVEASRPYALVKTASLPEVATFLAEDPRFQLNLLNSISTLDMLAEEKIACIYDIQQVPIDRGSDLITETQSIAIRVEVDRNDARVPSVAHVWPAADWHEREAYDLMGVVFENHPDLRRILCPDDWVGHALRKDYEFPLEYHGIPATTEFDLPNPYH